jgi:hypothetical protein
MSRFFPERYSLTMPVGAVSILKAAEISALV